MIDKCRARSCRTAPASLLEVRLTEIDARYQKLFDVADTELETTVNDDPALGRALPSFEFDIDGFCTSPEAAQQLRAQLDAGSAVNMDYAVQVQKP